MPKPWSKRAQALGIIVQPIDFIGAPAAGFNRDRIKQQTKPPSAETLRDRSQMFFEEFGSKWGVERRRI